MTDSILFWNAVALEANRISFSDPAKAEQQGPALSSRALTIVHLAMYDAYARIENSTTNFPLYLSAFSTPVPTTSSAEEKEAAKKQAVAGAAYTSLVKLYPSQKDFFDTQVIFFEPNFSDLNPLPVTAFKMGVNVANELLEIRKNDPGAGGDGYKPSPNRYRHRVDPDNPTQGYYAPFYGSQSKPFAVAQRQDLAPPPQDLASQDKTKYSKSLRQVRAKGIKPELMATLPDKLTSPPYKPFENRRTAEETVIGIYWAYDGSNRLGTTPRFYNQIVREVAMKAINPITHKINDEGDNARLFAFINAALGDAGIFAWEQKYCHDFWRPVLGIREYDESFGSSKDVIAANKISADADPNWLPLGAPSTNSPTKKNQTPNFPAYPSGHATFGAAALHITRLFYAQGVSSASGKPYKPSGKIISDTLLKDIGIVSEEFNGMNQDNLGTVRPRHVRKFPDGLGEMIIENALSRIYLGVHWSFDAFEVKGETDEDLREERIGGVSLGLRIAADIFANGKEKAPQMSPATANPPASPCEIKQPADIGNCFNKPKSKKAEKQTEETNTFELPYRSGISSR